MEAYLLDWANLLIRWLHFIAGVAWIGASFYFVMLDSSLSKPARKQDEERGVTGELWAVHGGGVYQSQKFLLGPARRTAGGKSALVEVGSLYHLVVGHGIARNRLLARRQNLFNRPTGHGVVAGHRRSAISIGFLVGGWIIYNLLCKAFKG